MAWGSLTKSCDRDHCQVFFTRLFQGGIMTKNQSLRSKANGKQNLVLHLKVYLLLCLNNACLAQWLGYVPWNLLVANAKCQNDLLLWKAGISEWAFQHILYIFALHRDFSSSIPCSWKFLLFFPVQAAVMKSCWTNMQLQRGRQTGWWTAVLERDN